MEYLSYLQWPAMAVTVLSAWAVASQSKRKRKLGFWGFIFSNILWIIWGMHDHAYALVSLQVALAFLNIRGAFKNQPGTDAEKKST